MRLDRVVRPSRTDLIRQTEERSAGDRRTTQGIEDAGGQGDVLRVWAIGSFSRVVSYAGAWVVVRRILADALGLVPNAQMNGRHVLHTRDVASVWLAGLTKLSRVLFVGPTRFRGMRSTESLGDARP